MKFKFLDKLSQDFLELLNDKEEYNVVFEKKYLTDFKASWLKTHFSLVYKTIGNFRWNDLMMQHFILPDRSPRIILTKQENCVDSTQDPPESVNETFSTVINFEHTAMISSWIGNLPQSYSLTYEFQLILHESKDGFSFWDICDRQSNTIVVEETDPLAWDKKNTW
ncbi:hypothetical protein Glove_168g266 [Diversispora epigaea]|uniref:Uncharacterized protein n=1 Tax=Diversispora epigaea TaxID=1348612 RepID=A0A397IZ08_9GLOM|nr:hypothetical protein Glove_168g266 [Diversispora epigaea]